MEAPKLSTGRYYRPELDVVRFLAFLFVYLHHTLPRGSDPRIDHILGRFAPALFAISDACGFGLSLFFTLSAFLICELLLRERDAVGSIHVKQFYIRRILRIWPLYYFGLALGLIVAFLPGGQQGDLARIGWFAVFLGAWQIVLQGAGNNPITPLWSISVEEHFYLLAPWIVKRFNRKSICGFCLVLILIANGWLFFLGRARASESSVWYNSFVQFECFAAGILLCLVLRGQLPKFVLWQRLALLASGCLCWFLASYGLHYEFVSAIDNPGSWPLVGGYALGALGSTVLLVAFLGVNPNLLPEWAIYLGRISFGLYVYHGFAIYVAYLLDIGAFLRNSVQNYALRAFLNAGLTLGLPLGLTVLAAALSYRYLETPFLRMKKRHSVIESQPIPGAN